MSDNTQDINTEIKQTPPVKKPDELSGLHVEAKIKIFDPETGEIKVEGRA